MTFSLHGAQPGALLDHPELLTYTWTAADRRTDRLQARLAALVGQSVAAGAKAAEPTEGQFGALEIARATGAV